MHQMWLLLRTSPSLFSTLPRKFTPWVRLLGACKRMNFYGHNETRMEYVTSVTNTVTSLSAQVVMTGRSQEITAMLPKTHAHKHHSAAPLARNTSHKMRKSLRLQRSRPPTGQDWFSAQPVPLQSSLSTLSLSANQSFIYSPSVSNNYWVVGYHVWVIADTMITIIPLLQWQALHFLENSQQKESQRIYWMHIPSNPKAQGASYLAAC